MQGWKTFIPTEQKIIYLNTLLQVGFDVLDFGSFVSPKAIPQMSDTKTVLKQLAWEPNGTKLLAIIANIRGAQEAVSFEKISYLGFPFSVSETFQQRNTNSTMEESLGRVEAAQKLCLTSGKILVVYLSMAFGNPYGDIYSEKIVFEWAAKMADMGISIISLADTVGLATPDQIFSITRYLVDQLPGIEIGLHLHSTSENWKSKIDKAIEAGCRRFDGALRGIGGCPMANDKLVGNMDTELMAPYFESRGLLKQLNKAALMKSSLLAAEMFV